MSISGNEELGVVARQSSNCSVGVPIKKRRFPLVHFPSSPPREPSSVLAENDSPQKEHSNQSQEPSLSNASVVTNSPSISDAKKTVVNKTSSSVEDKEGPDYTNANSLQNNVHLCAVKLEEPNLKVCSGRMDNMGSEEKLMFADRSAFQKIPRNTELHLAACSETHVLNTREGIVGKQEIEGSCKSEISAVPGNIELSLGLKEPLVPALAVQSSEGTFQVPEKSDHSSLCLSLSKEKPITQCKSDDNSNHDSSQLHANRSNWDLNTTMDTWEGSVDDATTGQQTVAFDGLNDTGSAHDTKSFSCSAGMVGGGVNLGKLILGVREHNSQYPISSLTPSELYKSEDSLHVGLSMSCFQSNFSSEHSSPSAKVDLGKVVSSSDFLGGLVSSRKVNSVGSRTVKSEPIEENAKQNFVAENGSPMGLFNVRTPKRELVERCNLEAVDLLKPKNGKLRSIKSELVQEGNQETHKAAERTSCQSNGKVNTEMLSTPQKLCSSVLPSCSTELTISGDVLNQSKYSTNTKECGSSDLVVSEMVSVSVGLECKESNVSDGMTDACRAEDLNVDDPETCRSKSMDELPLASCGNGEGAASDEEKINISADMLEEDSYASDYESDGYHTLVAPLDTKDRQYAGDDGEFEDGEVREPLVHNAIGLIGGEKKEADGVTLGDCGNKDVCSFGSPGDSSVVQSCAVEKDGEMKYHGETSDDHIEECVDIVLSEKTDRIVDKDGFLQDSSTVEVVAAEADEKRSIKTIERKPLDQSGNMEVQMVLERQPSTDGATNRSEGTVKAVGQAADGNIEGTVTEGKDDSTLPKTESSQTGDDAAKDANSGGNRRRIIKLPRASNVSSPVETSSIPVMSLPSQIERERYTGFERERFHPWRNREEMYLDGPRRGRFIRGRIQDQPPRNFRPNFMPGSGRSSRRLDTLHGDWDNDSELFASENFNGSVNYRFPRRKCASAGADVELECNGYIFERDGAIVGTDRGGRKPYNGDFPSFHHPSSRRRSPAGGDGAARHGIQMVRRMPRNINMTRCVGEDGSDLAGIKHGEKFLRGLPNDILEPVFSRPQPPYEGADGQFVRGNRNFSSVLRRGVPRIQSKSPIRSRTDSPGTWLSPRRRSPDGLNELPEMTNRRSPAIYRIERMRSPDHHFIREEIVARRHGSPPYMSRPSNNLRDMDAGREHCHPRSILPNRRSPSDRVLPRSTRRLDIVDTRERVDKDAYFGRPMQSGRLDELGCDGSGDEIRMHGVRRGPVRSFRPPYRDADGENFSFPVEDGPRPFRFCPEGDSEFLERSNLRERVSDRQIESRPINAPRRMRSIEEQEENYRHGGQVWHDNGFDDTSQGKRRRF